MGGNARGAVSAAAVAVISLSMLVSGCGREAPAAGASDRYTIVTTVGMVSDIVRQVAGDKAQVVGLFGEGVDPHLYKPTRDDVVALMRADVIFYCGLMLEGKMASILAKVGRKKPAWAVTDAIDRDYLLMPEGSEGHADPHVWMDPSAWAQAVQMVADSLSEYDPDNAAYYRQNAEAYLEQIRALERYGREVLATVPPQGRVMITSHDAFRYFGRAYDLTVLGVQGLSTESEAGLQGINSLIDLIGDKDVKAVFVETSVPQKNIRALIEGVAARGRRIEIGGSLFSDAMGPAGTYEGTYVGMLDHNITTVARALGGEAPPRGMQGKLSAHE